MNRGEFAKMISTYAKDYYKEGVMESVKRNSHMNNYKNESVPDEAIKAIITDFANFICRKQCIDLALYTEDLKK